jgi:hypothetical protein
MAAVVAYLWAPATGVGVVYAYQIGRSDLLAAAAHDVVGRSCKVVPARFCPPSRPDSGWPNKVFLQKKKGL